MGRELRMVPPNWEHPKKESWDFRTVKMRSDYKPMYDRPVQEAWESWQKEYQEWIDGEHDRVIAEYGADNYPKLEPYNSFCAWSGQPPDPDYYRPNWKHEEQTWFQVYETVSEGTPVSPPFETKEELVDYLVENGDFWDQKRRKDGDFFMPCDPWPRENAEKFVNGPGWVPSLVSVPSGVKTGIEAISDLYKES